jgi:hypothetical protein
MSTLLQSPPAVLAALISLLSCAAGCGPKGEGDGADSAADSGALGEPQSPFGRLVFEELYYAGAKPLEGGDAHDHYYADQFFELENRSEEPVALAGLCLGDTAGLAGTINPGNTPSGLATEDPEHVYLVNVWCLPPEAQGDVLRPGDTLVLAHDGTNHAPYAAFDLSDADFEAYNEREDGADLDYPTVPNLTRFHFTGGYDWLVTVFGPSMVLFVTADLEALDKVRVDGVGAVKVPVGEVIDGVDTLMDAASGDYKRLPLGVDSGFAYVSGTYSGESLSRVRGADGRPQDTNDSAADFELRAAPAPREAR